MNEHDPFNNPKIAHPRARELMREPLFWDCTDETTPFGSDEGNTSYYEWRGWRSFNKEKPLTELLNLILNGKIKLYNMELASETRVKKDLDNPKKLSLQIILISGLWILQLLLLPFLS